MEDIAAMCSEVGKGDEDKDQEVVQAVLTVRMTLPLWY